MLKEGPWTKSTELLQKFVFVLQSQSFVLNVKKLHRRGPFKIHIKFSYLFHAYIPKIRLTTFFKFYEF